MKEKFTPRELNEATVWCGREVAMKNRTCCMDQEEFDEQAL